MEEPELALSFDFEGGLDSAIPFTAPAAVSIAPSTSSATATLAPPASNQLLPAPSAGFDPSPPAPAAHGSRRSFRQTVCRHWLRGLCMKGDACGFLHQYDKARMPICRFFRMYGECREQDCVYKHTNEDLKECNMYKLGFCPNGPDCRYRHNKLPGPPPPVEEVLQKIQHNSFNHASSNRFFQHRNSDYNQQSEKAVVQTYAVTNQVVASKPPTALEASNGEQQSQNQQPQVSQIQMMPTQANSNGVQNVSVRTSIEPLPQGNSRFVRRIYV